VARLELDHRYIDRTLVLLFLVLSYNVTYLRLNVNNDHICLHPRVLDQCLCQDVAVGPMNKKSRRHHLSQVRTCGLCSKYSDES
jgi:hypothetical protein